MIGNALQVYGQFKAYLGVLLAFIIGPIIIFIATKMKDKKETTATINQDGTAKMVIDGKEYVETFYLPSTNTAKTVTVYYTDETPPKFTLEKPPPGYVKYIMIGTAIFFMILSIVIAYYVTTSKQIGAVYGGVQAANNVL